MLWGVLWYIDKDDAETAQQGVLLQHSQRPRRGLLALHPRIPFLNAVQRGH